MAFLSASQTGLHAWLSVVTGVVVVDMIPVWPSALNHVLDVLLLVLLLFFSPSVLTYLLLSVCLLSFSSLLALAVAIQHPSRSFPVTLATSQGSSAPGETPGREREKKRERETETESSPARRSPPNHTRCLHTTTTVTVLRDPTVHHQYCSRHQETGREALEPPTWPLISRIWQPCPPIH